MAKFLALDIRSLRVQNTDTTNGYALRNRSSYHGFTAARGFPELSLSHSAVTRAEKL